MISPYSMNDAVAEARRCSEELGFRAVFLRATPLVAYQWHDVYTNPSGMPWKTSVCLWVFTSPPAPANARSASGSSPI
jgi:hypothetical protein